MCKAPTSLLLLLVLGCSQSSLPNKQQGVASPSGKYVLRVPIEKQTTNPKYTNTSVWKVTITDPSARLLYKDEESTMVGILNVYWGWDKQDRVWLYNSDDGYVWRWELTPQGWKKIQSQESDGIPDFILPPYVKKR